MYCCCSGHCGSCVCYLETATNSFGFHCIHAPKKNFVSLFLYLHVRVAEFFSTYRLTVPAIFLLHYAFGDFIRSKS